MMKQKQTFYGESNLAIIYLVFLLCKPSTHKFVVHRALTFTIFGMEVCYEFRL